jgi:quinol monooxygenase YgiN
MFVRHQVTDYAAWKQVYDSFRPTADAMGCRGHAVFAGVEDGNDVTVWNDFDHMDAVQAFLDAPELKGAMADAGVLGEPQFWFVNREMP